MTLLRADGLRVERGGRVLVKSLDLRLGPGDALQVTGPNGAGKSSLLRCLAGLLRPAAGKVTHSGPIGLADERLPLDPELPLVRALGFWAGLESPPADPSVPLARLGLAPLADVPVRMLSSGQKKRAALALVTLCSARVWLLDEPLNGLDAESIDGLDRLLQEHREAGGAVVAASHQPLGPGDWRRLELGT